MRMYDRLMPVSVLESDRFIDLPTDTHQMVYVRLRSMADDFGNLRAGLRHLWRHLNGRLHIKDEAQLRTILDDLQTADLVRPYDKQDEHEARVEYLHIVDFTNNRTWTSRLCPMSIWCDSGILSTAEKRHGWPPGAESDYRLQTVTPQIQQLTSKPETALPQPSNNPASDLFQPSDNPVSTLSQGVGVGERVGERERTVPTKRPSRLKGDSAPTDDDIEWAVAFSQSQNCPLSPNAWRIVWEQFRDHWTSKGEARADWRATWRTWVRRENLRKLAQADTGPAHDFKDT